MRLRTIMKVRRFVESDFEDDDSDGSTTIAPRPPACWNKAPLTAGVSALNRLQRPGDPIFAGFKHGAFSLYFGDAPIYHFDLEGRWQRAFVDGTHYLKGLDANVHAIDRVREGPNLVLKRRTLADAEAGELDERVRSTALDLIAGLECGQLGRVEPASPKASRWQATELGDFLNRIGSWDPRRGWPIANGTQSHMVRSLSCRPNVRTRSCCKRPA